MEKSAAAFRTISEVADFLETPAHVLRFWESRFPQIKPVKRAGGRRYYRPGDVALLAGIKRLLHDEGMTIRGVQKILREQGVRHVSGVSETESEALDAALTAAFAPDVVTDKPEAQIVSLSEWVSVTDTPLAPKTTVPETAIPPETTIPEAVSPEVLPSDATTHPAATIEPVITDDEIVEEDAFRSAMDWAKSLGAADTSVSAPTDAILQLTERVAIEAGKQGDDRFAEAEVFAAEVYATIDDDFDPEDALHVDALSPDAAAESPSDDPVMDQPGVAASDSIAPTSPAPSHEETAANDQAPSIWLPTQLRARTAADLAPNSPTLRALYARLAALHTRMADAARSSRA